MRNLFLKHIGDRDELKLMADSERIGGMAVMMATIDHEIKKLTDEMEADISMFPENTTDMYEDFRAKLATIRTLKTVRALPQAAREYLTAENTQERGKT